MSEVEKLRGMIPGNNKIGHINNALDFVGRDEQRAINSQKQEIDYLNELGFNAEALNLQDYFNRKQQLREKINSLGALWVCGGNSFVLRQAMKLSGFDNIWQELIKREDFLYGGYSAGICILSKSLEPISRVDAPNNFPYPENQETIWSGLGQFEHTFMPHFESDHSESEIIGKEVERCIENSWPYKTLRDGEVIIIQ